jgi:hypothetical protein
MKRQLVAASFATAFAAMAVGAVNYTFDAVEVLETLSGEIVKVSFKPRDPANGRHPGPRQGEGSRSALSVEDVVVVIHIHEHEIPD